ncbi:FAD:protein FMN transferase [Caenibius sp. WL]|uniref:FAD:protein FMN transferase n=1 Tax=Caenibius sp. WL TaxID=2872646 RepID=UPI001C991A33|nr:FAD:protein FMN transferase [Caenibius sp. WL]QZP09190.1 FAD:protein FMN transferase [Caenibius sp. WL]
MTIQGGSGEVGELLLPPHLSPDTLRPLAGGRALRLDGETMGTYWALSAVVPPELPETGLRSLLEQGFARVIAQMSQWEPDSEISRFNRAAPGTRFPLSAEFAYVLDCALEIARASGGAFDPTLGGASDLWGFGASAAPIQTPDEKAVSTARGPNWRHCILEDGGRIAVQPGGLTLDLSGIAKGFAVDLGIRWLEAIGVHHALLEIGGELRGVGVQADGMPWWVDIDIPPCSDAPHARIALTGWAVATSGNYRRRRESDGQSWSHSLDPVSGAPLGDDVLSATALHPGCMQADALATVLMVLDGEKAMAFADAYGLPARVVSRNAVRTSAAWKVWAQDEPRQD